MTGGSDYVVTNNAITAFAISRLANPSGFPPSFSTTIDSGSVTALVMGIGSISGSSEFWMQGNIVYWTGFVNATTSGVGGQYVFVSLPINQLDASFPNVASLHPGIIVNEATPNQSIKTELNLASYTDKLAFSKLDTTDMALGGTFLQWSILYLIS